MFSPLWLFCVLLSFPSPFFWFSQVIGRIFYVVDRNWNGRLTAAEIRRSNFLQTLSILEEVEDLNQVSRQLGCVWVCVCVEVMVVVGEKEIV